MDDDPLVYVVSTKNGGNCDTYHARRDCPTLARAINVREKRLSVLAGGREQCRRCDGSPQQHTPDDSTFRALQGATPEDLGLSPLGDRGETP